MTGPTLRKTTQKVICSKINSKWCQDRHESGEAKCIHSQPHDKLYTCLKDYCITIEKKVFCVKRIIK